MNTFSFAYKLLLVGVFLSSGLFAIPAFCQEAGNVLELQRVIEAQQKQLTAQQNQLEMQQKQIDKQMQLMLII